MDPIFSRSHRAVSYLGKVLSIAAVVVLLAIPAFSLFARAQANVSSDDEFKAAVQQLSKSRLDGAADDRVLQQRAVTYLDAVATKLLNNPAGVDLNAANSQFATLVSHDPPIGENYRLMIVRTQPPAYALAVNFGLGGPAAVRIYTVTADHYNLAASVDSSSQKDFFDSDIEVVVTAPAEGIFVTISGRTDDLATGVFSAWRFDGQRLTALWTSDPLEHSSYELGANGFQITYCAKSDDDRPDQCPSMERDVYRFEVGEWKRVENHSLGPAKRS